MSHIIIQFLNLKECNLQLDNFFYYNKMIRIFINIKYYQKH